MSCDIDISNSNLGSTFLNDMGDGPIRPEVRNLVMGSIQAHFPPGEATPLFFQIFRALTHLAQNISIELTR